MKRSSNYNFFNSSPSGNNGGFKDKPLKDKLKLIWKYIRVVIYLFLAALTLTGCIQSFVLKSSSTVGSGIEFYNGDKYVAPYVNSFKINKTTVRRFKFDKDGNYIIDPKTNQPDYEDVEINKLDPLSKENYLVSHETITNLKQQLNSYGSDIAKKYGSYDNQSSSLRIVGLNDKNISDTKNNSLNGDDKSDLIKGTSKENYLFLNSSILNELNNSSQSYEIKNVWKEINFFSLKRPDSDKELTKDQKNIWGQGITSIEGAFQPFEQGYDSNGNGNDQWIPVKIENGKYWTYDADGDGINDQVNAIEITNPKRISKFRFAFDAEIVSVNTNEQGLFNSEKYARDFLQSITNVVIQFQQVDGLLRSGIFGNFGPKDEISVDERYNLLSRKNLEDKLIQKHEPSPNSQVPNKLKIIDKNKLLTSKQKDAILLYQETILDTISKSGFGIKKQIYDDLDSDESATWGDEYTTEFLPNNKDKRDLLIGAAPIAQKPITSWSDAWSLGPFYGLVVWPISYIVNGMVGGMPSMAGWGAILSLVFAVILSRVFTTLITYKSLFAQHKQQSLAPKKAKIDAKYVGFEKNPEKKRQKQQEISELYRKNNVSLFAPMLGILITMPIFFAMWRVIQGIPDIKSSTWLGIQFSLTSWKELFAGEWQYLPLLIVAIIVQIGSQLLPRYLNKKRLSERANVAEKAALKKSNRSQNIMLIFFVFLAVAFEAGVQIYWIVGGLWQIFQTLMVHFIVKTNFYKEKLSKYV